MLVDFHCHSSLSDGLHSPEYLAQALADAGVRFAALTDHNTLAGQARFQAAARRYGISWVSGVEISTFSPEGPVHLLAYGLDLSRSGRLQAALSFTRDPLRWLMRRWLLSMRAAVLRRGLGDDARRKAAEGVAGLRFQQGRLETEEAIRLVRSAGGLAFLAHPLTHLTEAQVERLLDRQPALGLDGIEAFYQPYPQEACVMLAALAARRGLLVTAGSDYHGAGGRHGSRPGVEMPDGSLRALVAALQSARGGGYSLEQAGV